MMIKLEEKRGFPQRHTTARKTPYLDFLDEVPEYLRSTISLKGIRDDLFQYHNKTKFAFNEDTHMKLAISLTAQAFSLPPVRPMHLLDVINNKELEIWSSSPCLPWSEYGYKTKKEVIQSNSNVASIRKFWSFVKKGVKMYPPDSMAHVRSHLKKEGEPDKVRAVWGYPLTMVLGEAMFALPIINAIKRSATPMAYGYETAVGGMSRIVKECKGKYFTALDFSRFDKTVPIWLIEEAFKILEYQIDFTRYDEYGTPNSVELYRCWDFIKSYFKFTTIRLANGERYKKNVGIPSGSYFTQVIDSIVNHIIITWCYLKLHGQPPKYIKVLGDDSLCSSDLRFDLDDAQDLFSLIGMELNVNKSSTSKYLSNIEFLGYQIGNGYPIKSYQKWLSSLAYPEFPDRDIDEFITRALGLGYACAAENDKFDTLVRFILTWKNDYELKIGRHFHRWLRSQGIEHLDIHLPTRLQFMRKMKY
jgi:hypothetical protein